MILRIIFFVIVCVGYFQKLWTKKFGMCHTRGFDVFIVSVEMWETGVTLSTSMSQSQIGFSKFHLMNRDEPSRSTRKGELKDGSRKISDENSAQLSSDPSNTKPNPKLIAVASKLQKFKKEMYGEHELRPTSSRIASFSSKSGDIVGDSRFDPNKQPRAPRRVSPSSIERLTKPTFSAKQKMNRRPPTGDLSGKRTANRIVSSDSDDDFDSRSAGWSSIGMDKLEDEMRIPPCGPQVASGLSIALKRWRMHMAAPIRAPAQVDVSSINMTTAFTMMII